MKLNNYLYFLISLVSIQVFCQQDVMHQKYGEDQQNSLDLFLPKTVDAYTPVLIMIHGGAWMLGGTYYTEDTAKDLRTRGFVVANIDYRYVSDSVHCADLLSDIDNAIGFVKNAAGKYHFSAEGFHLAGISAGAHLALLYGYTTKHKIKSVTALCAPTRLDEDQMLAYMQKHNLVQNIEFLADAKLNKSGTLPKEFTEVSPYAHISNIPTLLYHGDSDTLVPMEQSEFLLQKLRAENIESELVIMPGKGHDVGMNDKDSRKIILDGITAWVKGHQKSF